ncbi:acyl-CoA dehydrogenase family protein [Halalkalicoccus ordinarius]|uniref:acyl-CoA dehydrogenase family protein n=1 Tax=Halalkalicoccus ordinarius TaxID=3116651 RepID=UPI00300E9D06
MKPYRITFSSAKRVLSAGRVPAGARSDRQDDLAKTKATEVTVRNAEQAMQLHGGRSIFSTIVGSLETSNRTTGSAFQRRRYGSVGVLSSDS